MVSNKDGWLSGQEDPLVKTYSVLHTQYSIACPCL